MRKLIYYLFFLFIIIEICFTNVANAQTNGDTLCLFTDSTRTYLYVLEKLPKDSLEALKKFISNYEKKFFELKTKFDKLNLVVINCNKFGIYYEVELKRLKKISDQISDSTEKLNNKYLTTPGILFWKVKKIQKQLDFLDDRRLGLFPKIQQLVIAGNEKLKIAEDAEKRAKEVLSKIDSLKSAELNYFDLFKKLDENEKINQKFLDDYLKLTGTSLFLGGIDMQTRRIIKIEQQ